MAVDSCPERLSVVGAEASMPPRIGTGVEFCPRVAVESVETVERMEYSNFVLQTDSAEAAVDICPERMDAADAEATRPPRIETVVEF